MRHGTNLEAGIFLKRTICGHQIFTLLSCGRSDTSKDFPWEVLKTPRYRNGQCFDGGRVEAVPDQVPTP